LLRQDADRGGLLVRIVASVKIDRPASQVWAYVADYGNDPSWRGAVTQMRPSQPGPAQEGVTTQELLRLLGLTFRTAATIDRVEPGRRLQWRAHDRQKRLEGSRLVEPSGPASCRFTEVVEGRLLGPSRVLEPVVAWLLQQQTTADLGRLKQLLETSTVSGSAPEEPATCGWDGLGLSWMPVSKLAECAGQGGRPAVAQFRYQ
jgi:uncharacterized membrane protein